ncbi:hypothetical protein Dda_0938 [Drechslerella dactyloides]|uniref:Pet127-domain-containing protein n=1 Tax=Drechslerella dactyloides TaxID=74499 RepID=A0AAD6J646_DREDA|nr:hypothetical protein Dda_0938 [Drechslerella dactyloides]
MVARNFATTGPITPRGPIDIIGWPRIAYAPPSLCPTPLSRRDRFCRQAVSHRRAMLRTNRSLAQARLRRLTSPPPPWICQACRIHGSAPLRAVRVPSLSDVTFPPVGRQKAKGKNFRPDPNMSEADARIYRLKRESEHRKFLTKIKDYIATRENESKASGDKRKRTQAVRKGEKAREILAIASKLTETPYEWPSLKPKKAITPSDLVVLHMAVTESFPKKRAYTYGKYNTTKPVGGKTALLEDQTPGAPFDEPESLDNEDLEVAKKESSKANKKGGSKTAKKDSSKATKEETAKEEDDEEISDEAHNDHSELPEDPFEKPKRLSPKEKKLEVAAVTINSKEFQLEPIDMEQDVELRPLMHGLDRVLFNPGVTFLRDPRSRVYNFDPYLGSIMPVDEFDFDALSDYITSSKDTTLIDLARESGKKYVGSTSSMTAILSHLHYLLSRWRPLNLNMLSKGFETESSNFTRMSRLPVSVILQWRDGVYAIDQDKETDTLETILLFLGRSMEKMLTLPPEVFQKYHKSQSHEIPEEVKNARERYHYTAFGDLLFRSQLDAHDDRLPGTGVFDLKTRGVVSVRMNSQEPAVGWGYQIKTADGQFESFEREYYDLIRSAFMKYSLQVRMGRMDGCFVAYHNTKRIFGFQYISIDEMDEALHGGPGIGDQEFKLSLKLLNEALDRATKKYPEQSLRLWFETRESSMPFLYFAAEPLTPEQVQASRERTASLDVVLEQIKKSEERMSKPQWRQEAEAEAESASDPTEEAIKELLEEDQAAEQTRQDGLRESAEVLESVTIGGETIIDPKNRLETLLKEDGDDVSTEVAAATAAEDPQAAAQESPSAESEKADTAAEATVADENTPKTSKPKKSKTDDSSRDILVQVLVAQNIVNGIKVDRPTSFNERRDGWAVNYAFLDMDAKAANKTLHMMRKRKEDGVDYDPNFRSAFIRHLVKLSKQGHEYAEQQKKVDSENNVVVYNRRG